MLCVLVFVLSLSISIYILLFIRICMYINRSRDAVKSLDL